jgi:hypothetical protein
MPAMWRQGPIKVPPHLLTASGKIRKEVALPSQEVPSNMAQYALYISSGMIDFLQELTLTSLGQHSTKLRTGPDMAPYTQ